MNENELTIAVAYLLTFRLAVIILGGLSIYLGYRLFTSAISVSETTGKSEGSELIGKIGTAELTLKSAAPGTFFAAFGALITISVLVVSPPEVQWPGGGVATVRSVIPSEGNPPIITPHVVRGDDAQEVDWDQEKEAIERIVAAALQRSVELARERPTIASHFDLKARLEFASGDPDRAFRTQEQALNLENGNGDYLRRKRAYEEAR